MPFDVETARTAGKTDQEIVNYLAPTLGFDAAKARESGHSDKEIADYLGANATRPTGLSRRTPADTELRPTFDEKVGTGSFIEDKLKKGESSMVGSTFGLPVDAIAGLLRTAGVPVNKPYGGSQRITEALQNLIGYQNLRPPSENAQAAGTIAENIGLSVPYAGYAARAGRILPVATELAAGAGMGVGSTLAQQAYPGNTGAEIAGQVAGSLLPYRALGAVSEATKYGTNAKEAVNQLLVDQAKRGVAGDVAKSLAPEDQASIEKAIADYQRLRGIFPGLNSGAGEITGSGALLSMEREAAAKDLPALAESGARSRQNQQVLENAKSLMVPGNGRVGPTIAAQKQLLGQRSQSVQQAIGSIDAELERRNAAIQNAGKEPVQVGETLADVRSSEFAKSKAMAAAKYDTFRSSLGADSDRAVDASPVNTTISDLRREDPAAARMPNLFNTVDSLTQTEKSPLLLGPSGAPLPGRTEHTLSINDLLSIQKAAGQDIRVAKARNPPDREAARRLSMLGDQVSEAIGNSGIGQNKIDLFNEAQRYYREEHVPRFLEGVNYKQAIPDVYADLKIRPENLFDNYFKPGDITNARHFKTLYGDSPTANAAIYSGAMNAYDRQVIQGNMSHDAFMRKYASPMSQYPQIDNAFKTHSDALASLIEQKNILADQAKAIANSRIAKIVGMDTPDQAISLAMKSPQNMGALIMRMPKADRQTVVTAIMENGWDILRGKGTDSFKQWLSDNQNTLRTALVGTYGKNEAERHLANINDVTDLARIVERDPTEKLSVQAVRGAEDVMQEKFGTSWKTIWAQSRAILARRASPEWTAGVAAGQFASNEYRKAYLEAVRQALYDPETLDAFVRMQMTGDKRHMDKWATRAVNVLSILAGRDVPAHLAKRYPMLGIDTKDEEQ